MAFAYWTQPYVVDGARSPRVIMINETDPAKVINMQSSWLARNYPGMHVSQLAVLAHRDRIYSRAVLKASSGERKTVLFDVTTAYNSHMNTAMRNPPPGTLLRFWPGTGSAPARVQFP